MHAGKFVVACAIILLLGRPAIADDTVVVELAPRESKSIYFEINIGGTLYLKIRNPDGPACLELYWKTYPLWIRKKVGRVCDFARLDIPGVTSAAVAASLIGQADDKQTKVGISGVEHVAQTITINF